MISNFLFLPTRWLDEGEDDGKIVRELKLEKEFRRDLLEKQYVSAWFNFIFSMNLSNSS